MVVPALQRYEFASAYEGASLRLRLTRERLGLTLRQVGAAAGISIQGVLNCETGATVPRVDNLERLAVALDVSPCWLAYGVGDPPAAIAAEQPA